MPQLSPLNRNAVLDWLKDNVPKSRVKHTLRVEIYSHELAARHRLDTDLAVQAALLHDLAKYFKPQRLLAMAQDANLDIDPVAQANPHLLHANVSALVAQQEFGVTHPTILAAIENHTLGAPAMDAISRVVFLADSLEPGRGDTSDLNHIRTVCQENLAQGVLLTCDRTLQHLVKKGKLIHPQMVQTRNWFLHNQNNAT